ncbi:hypothetical protein D9757_009324 [Collybiopsis confluens]|uniref:Microbial-type PARG catalytic domain-containing protein n=1 Tax=Collybiopsis confluens TaxID=2823264 RepID=A0A8H5H3S9_9AGAR|nr:hypothetical protein D9757_009324 [Collybiopsis confluens]
MRVGPNFFFSLALYFTSNFAKSNPLLPEQSMPSHEQLRMSLVEKNKHVFASIIAEHASDGASPASEFIDGQLPPLNVHERPYSEPQKNLVEVINGDTFLVARELMDAAVDDANGRVAVLNLASDQHPGGGWETGSIAQEECLCYSSTLYHTLTQPDTLSRYPWPNTGPGSVAGIFSEGVVVFREPLHVAKGADVFQYSDNSDPESIAPLLPAPARKVLSVITVAAPRYPRLTSDGSDFADKKVEEELKEKVRLVLRMAGLHGKRYLVLGAMGCGAYFCPPSSVARLMKSVILEKEFEGWFSRIVFAVLSSRGRGDDNFEIFREVMAGTEV